MHFYDCIIKVEVDGNRTISKSAIRYWKMMIDTKLGFKEDLKYVCQNATNTLRHLHEWARVLYAPPIYNRNKVL